MELWELKNLVRQPLCTSDLIPPSTFKPLHKPFHLHCDIGMLLSLFANLFGHIFSILVQMSVLFPNCSCITHAYW